MKLDTLLVVLDYAGTFAFGLSGAAVGIRRRLDLFGVLVLAFATAIAGGVARDVVIGAIPPAALSDLRYTVVPIVAGLVMFSMPGTVRRLRHLVALFDAAGLAVFAVTGTDKALAYGINPISAALLGMLTGIGGGIVRDMLVNDIPIVLRGEIYAVAALAAAALVVVGHWLQLPVGLVAVVAMLVCFALRLVAIWRHWRLPVAATESDEHLP